MRGSEETKLSPLLSPVSELSPFSGIFIGGQGRVKACDDQKFSGQVHVLDYD